MDYRENSYKQNQDPERSNFDTLPENDLPLPSAAEQHKLREVGTEAISNLSNHQEIIAPEEFNGEPALDIIETDPSPHADPMSLPDTADFSHHSGYSKIDNKIVQEEISLLEKQPYEGTEMVHRDKEKYLMHKFARQFGEKAA